MQTVRTWRWWMSAAALMASGCILGGAAAEGTGNPPPAFTNRLTRQSSPYLLRHAHNPVDWYPWSDEAFKKAKKENKPVLLSLGYSGCHWCRLMERESFEDPEIARFLNEHYVAVLVDREERPDVDKVYMTAARMLGAGSSWPLTVWMTPGKEPFFAANYLGPRDTEGQNDPAFLPLLARLADLYAREPEKVAAQAKTATDRVASYASQSRTKRVPGDRILRVAFEWYASSYDATNGGFGDSPKFPQPGALDFLFRFGSRIPRPHATEMALHTLRHQLQGGVYDQIGGGFHRYAVDRAWRIPHFEKTLSENAQLVLSLLSAYQITRDPEFERAARETLDFISRDLSDEGGGFFSSIDAESEGGEGRYYVWSPDEITRLLGDTKGNLFSQYFDVTKTGNFEGKNVLYAEQTAERFAKDRKLGIPEVEKMIRDGRRALFNERLKRTPPAVDRTVVSSLNGLAVGAFACASWVLGEPAYEKRAREAADFILKNLVKDGRLMRSYAKTRSPTEGYLDDYTFLTFGLLELFEATQELRWLKEARRWQDLSLELFWDDKNGGFFLTGGDHETVIARMKPFADGEDPSGNSMAAANLLRLALFTEKSEYEKKAKILLNAFGTVLENRPHVMPFMLSALDFHLDRVKEIVIVAPKGWKGPNSLLDQLRRTYVANHILVVAEEGEARAAAEILIPLIRSKRPINGKPTAYVCTGRTCDLPASDPEQLALQLGDVPGFSSP